MKNFDTTWKQIEEHLLAKQADLNLNDIVLIGLDRSAESMMSGAYHLNNGVFQSLSWATSCGGELADEAAVLADDDTILVKFHETRLSTKDKLPNGIRCEEDENDEDERINVPVAVFLNVGNEPVTVNGFKLATGEFKPVWKAVEVRLDDPGVQAEIAQQFMQRKEVRKEIESLREELKSRKISK